MAEALPANLLNPDKTTAWLRDFETREQLAAWLRFHGVTGGSFERALQEYDIGRKNVTVKRFEVNRGRRKTWVKVLGSRRWRTTRRERERRGA